jgi:eukaryotic-like serine/threonine-protein kinase
VKNRLQWIGEARVAIAKYQADPAGGTDASPEKKGQAGVRPTKLPWAVAAIAIVAALALGVVSYRHVIEEQPRVVKMSVLPPEKATVANTSAPALSPDGRHLAFVATTEGKDQLWVRDLDSLAARALTGTEGAYDPFWSPDSRSLAFFADRKLKKIEVAGGPALTLCDTSNIVRGGSWSKNGVIVFAVPGAGNFRVSAAGGTAAPVTQPDAASGENIRFPWFLPDGRHFLYLITGVGGKSGIYTGDVDFQNDAKSRRRVIADNSMAAYVPPGYLLFVRDRTLMAQPFDAVKLQTTGDAVPIAEQIDAAVNSAAQYQFSVSQNGVLAYSSGAGTAAYQLTWVDRSGKVAGTAGPLGAYNGFRLSPDEKRIAFDRNDAGNQDIWVMDTARGVTSRLTFDPASDNNALWSPDGLRILYVDNRSRGYDLYGKAATGAGKEEVLIKMGTPRGWGTSWSRDGRVIMYTMPDAKTRFDLWVAPQFGDRKPFPYLQTQFNEVDGAFSPDGHWVAYMSDESGRNETYVQAFPLSGAKFQISTGGGGEPTWRNNGSELFYRSADGNLMAVPVKLGATFEAGVPKSLFPVPGNTGSRHTYAVSNDGQRFLIAASAGVEKSVPMTVVLNWQAGLKK